MSRRSFTRLFRDVAGCSYAEYVERVRIEYACRLLRETARDRADRLRMRLRGPVELLPGVQAAYASIRPALARIGCRDPALTGRWPDLPIRMTQSAKTHF